MTTNATTALDDLDRQRDALMTEALDLLNRADEPAARDRVTAIEEQIDFLSRRRQELVRMAQHAALGVEGDQYDRDPLGDPADTYRGRANPWDGALTRNATPEDTFSRAVDAIAQVPGMTDTSREVATRRIEAAYRDESHDHSGPRVSDVVLLTTDPNYVSGFARWWRGETELLSTEERAAMRRVSDLTRAMSAGTGNVGGYLVPESLDPALIIADAGAISPMRDIARVKLTATRSATFVLSTAVTGSWDGEAAEVSDDTTTLTEVPIVAYKRQAFIPYSIELELTAAGNLTAELAKLFADGKLTAEATAFVTGSGTNQPTGFVTALAGGSSIAASLVTDTFAIGDVYALFEAVPVRYRPRARWLGTIQAFQDIRQFASADSPSLWARLAEDKPELLLGRPAHEMSTMDSTVTPLANNYYLALGDWQSGYGIVDRIGLIIERVEHVVSGSNGRPTGQRGAYAYSMTGGDTLVDDAIRVLNVT